MDKLPGELIERFINEGFVKLENAFPQELADECCTLLWKVIALDPARPDGWTKPVIWVTEMRQEPFTRAANTPFLLNAYDQIAGIGNWLPRMTMGSFPIRFPVHNETNDTGWHVDASFPGEGKNDYTQWRINIRSKGRALLMLFLFSDVSEKDAPTRLRVGSHFDVAKILKPEGEKGLSFMELAHRLDESKHRKETLATGKAGTVFLCHPFIVHAAQPHRGNSPKFMAQPPLLSKTEFSFSHDNLCPVEKAILKGLNQRLDQ